MVKNSNTYIFAPESECHTLLPLDGEASDPHSARTGTLLSVSSRAWQRLSSPVAASFRLRTYYYCLPYIPYTLRATDDSSRRQEDRFHTYSALPALRRRPSQHWPWTQEPIPPGRSSNANKRHHSLIVRRAGSENWISGFTCRPAPYNH